MNSGSKNERILVMESDIDFGDQLANGLRREGYAVQLVRNGSDGLKSILEFLPHLIIIDAVLDGGNSYDILVQKQAEQMIAKIPVIMISSQADPLNMRKIPEGSVSEFIMSLNMEPSKLVDKVNRFLGHQTATETAEPGQVSKKKVLWVEDDRLIGSILSKKIVSSGFDLFHARTGEEALEMIKSITPDIIVVDLVLPNVSGFDFIAEVKKDSRVNNIPIMILSNLSKQSDMERAKELGVRKYIVKASASLDKIIEEMRGTCR
jgi:adenylate cyclase